MKKIFTLAAAVLASMAMMADPVYKSDFSAFSDDENGGYYTDLKTNTYASFITDGWMSYVGSSTGSATLQIDPKDDSAITGKSASYGKVKANGSRHMEFYVTNVSSIKFYFANSGSSDRKIQYILNDGTATDLVTVVQKTSDFGSIALDATTNNKIRIFSPDNDVYVCALKVTPLLGPSIKSIQIAGVDCEIVKAADAADPDTIKGELPYGTVVADAVAAITTDDFVLGGTATSLRVPYPYTSVYARDDDGNEKEYFIACTVNATVSTDATLKSLSLNNIAVVLEEDVYEYNLELPYATLVSAAYEVNDVAASAEVTSSTDAQIVVTVTAQAGNHQAYTVNYVILPAKKDLLEAAFSNGAKGAITDGKIRVPYLASEEEPTFTSARFWNADGEPTAVVEGTNLKVTGIDGVDSLYALEFVALTPAAVAYDTEITFDSTETYIFSTYGFGKYIKDSDYRGWKFAKAVEEATNKRISDGRARLYFAIPAADSLILVSGTGGERGIKVYVNGVENTTVTKTAKNNESIVLKDLRPDAANFIAIESNQTGGDGGFIKMQLGKPTTTALDNTDAAVKAEKVIREGQVLIIRDGKTFNVLGARVR